MTRTNTRNRLLIGGLLFAGFGFPQISAGASGCNNSYLSGTYNAQVSNSNTLSNLMAGGAGAPTVFLNGGPFSLTTQSTGIGRYFFDGAGNIIGRDPSGVNANLTVGSYNVNDDCTMTMQVSTGQNFTGVLTANGSQVLFLQTDANGMGATGVLTASPNSCGSSYLQGPQSYGFAYSGAEATTASQSAGSSTSTSPSLQSYSAVGTLSLDLNGNFTMNQWVFASGAVQQQTFSGTYAIGTDCSLSLSYAPPVTGASPVNPQFNAMLANGGKGLVAVTPPQGASLPGQLASAGAVQQ